MSDMAFPAHTLACDWPGCDRIASYGRYGSCESYAVAVAVFVGTDDDVWLHKDGRDYCPKHWHLDEEWQQVPGPDAEDSKNLEEKA
ncbi:hypothetical protein [Bifidobacterium sp. ESL0819]|uniref:hypothetical protein n=1 Tax=Bifidobacterium sp. ESL0819 TaxID=3448589 RepID=UPI0040432871